uniref:Single-stranded-DNA-specific exonuclease RecJ n=1 Tax=Magnetococcus massalia (strain MO-1) TaxID=451514 RepID=A0A1S7LFR5_MAGMO|nr:ssDNA exonuclease, 5'--> 3'-specific. Exonuclease RecJ [Candidatus Magnetococcus massalia]
MAGMEHNMEAVASDQNITAVQPQACSRLSLTGRVWRLRSQPGSQHYTIAQSLGLSPYLSPLLASRDLQDPGESRRFLEPRLNDLVDPNNLLDMQQAVERLVHAMEQGEEIAVFGDYDVDGATSSALLVRYFRAIGRDIRVYIPNRLTEGYGPSPAAMETLKGEGTSLVITVDCGITAYEALEKAQAIDLDVIITDHHQARETLPPALAVINPNRQDEPFPYKELAGVGVAFYLVMALNRALRDKGFFKDRTEPDLKQLLDLVAVGTVADVAGMTGLNRALVSAGLKVLSSRTNPGFSALVDVAGIKRNQAELSATHIGFQLGPRLNAGGRLGQGELGYQLLASTGQEEAYQIAETLDESNKERQGIERGILDQAKAQVKEQDPGPDQRGLVVAGEGWHPGVIGIVASRLTDRHWRPSIVIAIDPESGIGKGSARAIPGINLLAAIEAGAEHLEHFGGHKAAAGLTIHRDKLEAFSHCFEQHLHENYDADDFIPQLTIDAEIPLEELDMSVARQLCSFAPFGPGNPEPVVVFPRVSLRGIRVLKEKHMAATAVCPVSDSRLDLIGFRLVPGPIHDAIMEGEITLWDVAGHLTVDSYRGRERIQLKISDIRPAIS